MSREGMVIKAPQGEQTKYQQERDRSYDRENGGKKHRCSNGGKWGTNG